MGVSILCCIGENASTNDLSQIAMWLTDTSSPEHKGELDVYTGKNLQVVCIEGQDGQALTDMTTELLSAQFRQIDSIVLLVNETEARMRQEYLHNNIRMVREWLGPQTDLWAKKLVVAMYKKCDSETEIEGVSHPVEKVKDLQVEITTILFRNVMYFI